MTRTVSAVYFLANATSFILAQCSKRNRYKYMKGSYHLFKSKIYNSYCHNYEKTIS